MPRTRLLPGLILLSIASHAFAWNKPGHQIIGAIAYDLIKRDTPQALEQRLALLRQHPLYNEMFAKRLEAVEPDQRDRYLFMLAARWPDDVKQEHKEFNRPKWHYINYPVVPPDEADQVRPPEPDDENIVMALKLNVDILNNPASAAADRAVALCWVLHLVGDLHQPLHTVSLFTKARPKGDRGGNGFTIRVRDDRAVIDLHAFWDNMMTSSQRYKTTGDMAIELRNRPAFAKEMLTELTIATTAAQWATESADLAKRVAYVNGTLKGGTTDDDAAVLPAGYVDMAKSLGERRIVLAGHRLAALLTQ